MPEVTLPEKTGKEKSYELKQQRSELLNENRTAVERAEKENRGLTPEEKTTVEERFTKAQAFAERISMLDRIDAVSRNGKDDPDRRSDPLPHEDPNNVGKRHRYSILRAVKCFAERRAFDGLEAEVSSELAKRTGKSPQGFMMPYRTNSTVIGGERRALDSTAGTGAVSTSFDKDWIELLRNQMQVKAAGAREIMDLVGKFAIPRQSAAATAYWVAESGAPTGSNQTLDQVLFTPHTIGAFTDISRRFFELINIDSGEEFVKEDLTAILGRGVDLAAINGLGSSNQPLGILQNTAVTATNTVPLGTNGGVPTFTALVDMVTQVKRSNAAALGEISFMTNADGEGTLATTPKIGSTYPVFLLEDGKAYGRKVLSTQQVPSNLTKGSGSSLSAIIAGVWNQLVIGYWSGVNILVDPYTGSSSGTVRVVALQDMDIQLRHALAFSVIVDMISNQS